ncbi:ParB/RepB/Spo0J family partition protein [Candidatus Nucleicultrix amoebiphila]|jgi:ParB family chromosome partitioning protein|uniref:ParB-like N-terminal domain-containing protein n=1 Tax=Candidatus Nucleicultrix amoebiphila FS5 TaxID=1414854 RepID=A0A1W6N531_9PROT|nr:ParB/RepB/Spo0J family partition protein [Candidatus Nucleicultrix amoebiphila]ARN84878.1 hypothetical protein GQ61_05775 [Candidatus Nucleicultrix amoebiphila FS5]
MVNPSRSLGRGLSAILGPDLSEDTANTIRMININDLVAGRYQPRSLFDDENMDSLVASVKEKGILQPIIVRPLIGHSGPFEIVAGERRWRSAQKAGLDQVPVIVRPLSDVEALETALIENVQRQDLNPLEEAEGYQKLMVEFHHTQEELGKIIGKSRSHIANILRLLTLPEDIQSYVRQGKLTAGHARSLVGQPNARELAEKILNQNLTVRQTEKLVQETHNKVSPKKLSPQKTAEPEEIGDNQQLTEMISNLLGVKAEVSLKNKPYQLTLYFKDLEQLDQLLDRFTKNNEKL